MADDLYDADCDVARFLQSPGRDSHLLDFNEPTEAAVVPGGGEIHQHVPADEVQPAPSAILDFPQPTIDDAGQHQAPAAGVQNHPAVPVFGYQAHMVNVGGHVVPAFGYQALLLGDDFEQQSAFDFEALSLGDELHQAQVFGFQHPPSMYNVEHDQASASSGFQVPANVEHQEASPFVFQAQAISAAQHHQAPVMDVFYHHQAPDADDVEHHEMLAEPASNILPSPPRSHREDVVLEAAGMLGNILMPTPAVNGEAVMEEQSRNAPEAPSHDSSLPVAQLEANNDAENRFQPDNYLGFTPEILESSLVEPYDPASGISVLLYPSMLEKIRESEQVRYSDLTLQDVSNMLEEMEEEAATELDFSSMLIFKQLCREGKAYHKDARRIKNLNKKIKNLKKSLHQGINARDLFTINQKALMHKQEKERLITTIDIALKGCEANGQGAAGPSGS